MKCDTINSRFTIKVPADNSFRLILPLKTRTYVSNVPIDSPIVYAELEDVVLTIGGTEYAATLGLQGVEVYVADGLAKGVYDIILTATYHGALIRAAYFEALHAVEWQYLSDFQQYLVGSPIVADAAIVIGGPLTDAQLEELKEQYVEATADARAAEADALAEKEKYIQLVTEIGDLATEEELIAAKDAIMGKDMADPTDTEGKLPPILSVSQSGGQNAPCLFLQVTDEMLSAQLISELSILYPNAVQIGDALTTQQYEGPAEDLEKVRVCINAKGLEISGTTLVTGGEFVPLQDGVVYILSDIKTIPITGTQQTAEVYVWRLQRDGKSIADAYAKIQDVVEFLKSQEYTPDDPNFLTYIYELASALYELRNVLQGDDTTATLTALQTKLDSLIEGASSLAATVATEATSQAILAAVKNNDTTALGELLSQTHGLEAIKDAIAALVIPTVQEIQNGLAKTSELPTDYAKEKTVVDFLNYYITSFFNPYPLPMPLPILHVNIFGTSGGNGDIMFPTGKLPNNYAEYQLIPTGEKYYASGLTAGSDIYKTVGGSSVGSVIGTITKPIDVIDAVKSAIGTSSDTSSTATIFGKLASVLSAIAALPQSLPTDYAKEATLGASTDTSADATIFGKLKELKEGQPTDYAKEETVNTIRQFFNMADGYEAEAMGEETTNNPVIDDCKAIFAAEFSGLLPAGFDWSGLNSVEVDGTTYSGTINS